MTRGDVLLLESLHGAAIAILAILVLALVWIVADMVLAGRRRRKASR